MQSRFLFAIGVGAICLTSLSAPASAQAARVVLANADADVSAAHPYWRSGGRTSLRVGRDPLTRGYVRFRLRTPIPAGARAILRLYVTRAGASPLSIYTVRNRTWRETTINYANAPRLVRSIARGRPKNDSWLSFDVSSVVRRSGTYTFALAPATKRSLTGSGGTAVTYLAAEKRGRKARLIVDKSPPSTPSGLTAETVASNFISLSWQPSNDDVGVVGYSVYQGGAEVARVTTTSTTVTGLACASSYSFSLDAYDAAGRHSAQSPAVLASTTVCEPPLAEAALRPGISGVAQEGEILTVSRGGWTGSTPMSFDYTWQRCDVIGANCIAITGATKPSYTLTSQDIASTVRAMVTASNGAGSASAVSDVSAVVAGLPPADSGWVEVVRTTFDGPEGTAASGALPAPWGAYRYPNSRSNGGWYRPEHVVISNGVCSLVQKWDPSGPAAGTSRTGYENTTGAGWYQGTIRAGNISNSIDHRTTFRMRIVPSGVSGVVSHRNLPLWWPVSGTWPVEGEEDFFENNGSYNTFSAFFHYGSINSWVYVGYPVIDATQWHVYTHERSNHRIRVWIDGTLVIDRQLSSIELPDTLKQPVFQQENPSTGPPPGKLGEEQIQIDWIVIAKPA